jgi:GMP synthase-like glutamine amidotransferase
VRLLVFQHMACEHPGIFRQFLAEDGIEYDAIELDEGERIPPLEDYGMLWVMGGPMDVWDVEEHPWLIAEKRAIRHWVRELRRPFLGVCLGHQLLADALGGTCGPQRPPEVGILDIALTDAGRADALFTGLPPQAKALQWHSVRVAQPPEDALVLARSEVCGCQAMRIGANAYSLQYHIEIEPETIPSWGCVPAYEAALAKVRGPGALEALMEEARPLMPQFTTSAQVLYRNFMRIAGWPRRRRPESNS